MRTPTDRLDRTRYALRALGFEPSARDSVLLADSEIAIAEVARRGLPFFLPESRAPGLDSAPCRVHLCASGVCAPEYFANDFADDADLAASVIASADISLEVAADELLEALDDLLDSFEAAPIEGDHDPIVPPERRYLEFPSFGPHYGTFLDPDSFPDRDEYGD